MLIRSKPTSVHDTPFTSLFIYLVWSFCLHLYSVQYADFLYLSLRYTRLKRLLLYHI